jgi:hypothetical protein
MIYCNAAECTFMIDAFRCYNFYNADGDEVTTILTSRPHHHPGAGTGRKRDRYCGEGRGWLGLPYRPPV